MALSYLTDINLNKNELQNAVIQNLGTDPSSGLVDGWIIYNSTSNELKVYNGSAWTNVGGDITQVTAGTGLTGGGTAGAVTLNLANTAVTPQAYGSSTAIPVITIDAQGRITDASTAAISSTITISDAEGTPNTDGVTVGTDTLVFEGTANEVTTIVSNNKVKFGLPDNIIIAGNLTVNGTTTTVNSNTVNIGDNILLLNSDETGTPSQDAGFEVERGNQTNVSLVWDESEGDWSFKAYNHHSTPALVDYKIPTTFSASIGDGSATAIAVAHNLGSRDVIVQLFDNSTFDTVYADVVRTNTNTVTISFASAPVSNDIRVLISTIG